MKKLTKKKSPRFIIAGYPILLITLGALISFIVPSAALAEELVTFEGTIQGLNCVHYQQKCPEENLDMYIALEHDFVLLLPDGSHFVLPNLDRGIKARYLTKDVRIQGKQKGTTLWVEKLEVKEKNQYKLVWDFQIQRKMNEAP